MKNVSLALIAILKYIKDLGILDADLSHPRSRQLNEKGLMDASSSQQFEGSINDRFVFVTAQYLIQGDSIESGNCIVLMFDIAAAILGLRGSLLYRNIANI